MKRITLRFKDHHHGETACRVLAALGIDFDNDTEGQFVHYAHSEGAMLDLEGGDVPQLAGFITATMAPFVAQTWGIVTEDIAGGSRG